MSDLIVPTEPTVKLSITYAPGSGQVRLECSTQDRVINYGLLGMARQIIIQQAIQQGENRVQPATIVPRIQ